ncbi:MAG: antitoxin VbhA family protein [Zoogloeaceae bacterium]|nr:antitoxin VbhA family protein [Zoogloeaceae bacterium]
MLRESTVEERQRATDYALADGIIEGFKPDTDFLALLNRFISGEISYMKLIASVHSRALKQDRQALPEHGSLA